MSTPSGPGGAFPLPEQWLPDNQMSPELNRFAERVQKNMERISLGIGGNVNTIAPIALTGLYSGTWTGYTATAGFTPYYGKRAGVVFMGGAVTKSPSAVYTPGDTILTMPAGFRPASTEQFIQMSVGGVGGPPPTTGVVIVELAANGVMKFISGVTGGGLTNNLERISLSGITYGAAA